MYNVAVNWKTSKVPPQPARSAERAGLFSGQGLTLYGRQVLLLYEMLRAWWKGSYPLPWRTAAAIGAFLIYFVNPIDLIPDFIPVIGHLDDLVFLALCVQFARKDMGKYAVAAGKDPAYYGLL